MRTSILFTALLLFSAALPKAFAQNPEEDAIKKVIRAETETYYNRDAQGWENTWAHTPDITRTFTGLLGMSTTKGWDSVGAEQMRDFKGYTTVTKINLSTENYVVRVDGNVASVEYDQTLSTGSDTTKNKSREYRTLVKLNNEWKIASQVTVGIPNSDFTNPGISEAMLNTLGYAYLNAKRNNDAIDLFKLNVKFNPKSWNVFDSLGEAYAAAGNKDLAIKNYEQSIALNPKNEAGKTALAKLKTK